MSVCVCEAGIIAVNRGPDWVLAPAELITLISFLIAYIRMVGGAGAWAGPREGWGGGGVGTVWHSQTMG